MDLKIISDSQKSQYNKSVTHVMQSWQWGEFREQMGVKLSRFGLYDDKKLIDAFQITFHKIPFLNQYVGYLPKGPFPDQDLAKALKEIGQKNNCAFIKLEPNIKINNSQSKIDNSFKTSPKPMFSKHNFLLDLTPSEERLLANMHPKTRYNIRVAEKHGVKVEDRTDDGALEIYLKLYFETTKRQGFAGHNANYHRTVFKTLKEAGLAKLMIATYEGEPLTAWCVFIFKDTIYYAYGGSSKSHPEVMSNNLVCWEVIKLGKKLGLKTFDMWGALGSDPDPKDPWIGFHRFKKGYGGELVEYIGTYDYILNWPIYILFTFIDKLLPLKIFLLKLLWK
jgi:lipid II:glycine glycyltransferase (peptidoglycan interpeptide bridge formation enzyme)